jgi:TolB protein
MRSLRLLTRRSVVALLGATALTAPILASATSARAVVPGSNGQILFTRQLCQTDNDPCWELVVADATDTHETVVAGPYPRTVFDDHFMANWSPDGGSLIFMADLGAGQAIWRVKPDGTDLHRVFAAPPDGSGLDDAPAFTPDGRWIIFTRCCPQPSGYGLWKVHPDGSSLRIVTTETVSPKVDGPADGEPQVSPDGRTIVFGRDFATGSPVIATVNFAGGQLRELTAGDMNEGVPNWSPDGQHIVFQGSDNQGVDLWRVNPDGTGLSRLTVDGSSLNPSYSPDGTKIIFSHVMTDGSRDLFTMNPDGGGMSQLTHTPATERFPQWAPAR